MADFPRMQKGSKFLTLTPPGVFLEQGKAIPKSFYGKANVKEIRHLFLWNLLRCKILMLLENKSLSTNKRSTNISECSTTQLRELKIANGFLLSPLQKGAFSELGF